MIDNTRTNAERILSRSFGQPVYLGVPSALRTSGRFNVTRFRVTNSSSNLPDSVVVKRVTRPDVENDTDAEDDLLADLFNEWAALKFLGQISGDDRLTPRLFGGCRCDGAIVIEDLGTNSGANDLLWKSNANEAEEGLNRLAATLGRMHSFTIAFLAVV